MTTDEIVAWVVENIQLGDTRRSRALGEMAWALMEAGVVSYTEIGRHMEGRATPASQTKRVARFCSNEHVEPHAVQEALVKLLVGRALARSKTRVAIVAIDWHTYDNGEISGLRVSLITGSRALPLLWYEIKTADLGGQQSSIEHQALQDLNAFRPDGVEWLMLLDCGFHSSELIDALDATGAFIVRSGMAPNVHRPGTCWDAVGNLPVELSQLVEFGWVHWSIAKPREVRLVAGRIAAKRRPKRGRRSSNRHYKYSQPGFCVVITNLPLEDATAAQLIQLYGRRFEIEHSFRDIKNATLGLDMEHVHLRKTETYARLMCIVALAEALMWLFGAAAEALDFQKRETLSRPKDGHRVLSLVRLGRRTRALIHAPIDDLIQKHLRRAIQNAPEVQSRYWKQLTDHRVARGYVARHSELPPLKPACTRRKKKATQPCNIRKRPLTLPAASAHRTTQRQAA